MGQEVTMTCGTDRLCKGSMADSWTLFIVHTKQGKSTIDECRSAIFTLLLRISNPSALNSALFYLGNIFIMYWKSPIIVFV